MKSSSGSKKKKQNKTSKTNRHKGRCVGEQIKKHSITQPNKHKHTLCLCPGTFHSLCLCWHRRFSFCFCFWLGGKERKGDDANFPDSASAEHLHCHQLTFTSHKVMRVRDEIREERRGRERGVCVSLPLLLSPSLSPPVSPPISHSVSHPLSLTLSPTLCLSHSVSIQIAVEGCCHGQLDDIYASIQDAERQTGQKVDLLLCCGDFQAVRNMADLSTMACPNKYKSIGTFYKYYTGEKVCTLPCARFFMCE